MNNTVRQSVTDIIHPPQKEILLNLN